MATYRKRSSGWRAEVARLGVRDSATFPTKAEAVAWATQREAEIIQGSGRQSATSSHTLYDAFERYSKEVSPTKKGTRWERVRLKQFERTMSFAGNKLENIGADSMAKWRDERLLTVSTATVRRELNLVSSVFNYAIKEWRWCNHNPTKQITWPRGSKPRDRRISPKEEKEVIDELKYRDGEPPVLMKQELAYAFLIALETAMRLSEILNLTWGNVYLSKRYVHLEDSKNSNSRDVPLSSRAVELFEVLKLANNSPNVFRLKPSSASVVFRSTIKKLGINNLCFHDTRHEATTRLARKLDVLDLARMTGHKDTRSLMVYYNATATEMAARLG